jgi:phage I-like protein
VKAKRTNRSDLVGLTSDLALGADGKAPDRFRIFKAGINSSTKGDILFDAKAAEMVMASFAKHGVRLTMDYEHQALNSEENGKPAPASAYSWRPEVINGELWACDVKWTSDAARMIEAHEYNYQSPLFKTDKAGRVTWIANLALTNIPALDDQQPLIAASANDPDNDGDIHMKCKACKETIKDDDDAFHSECATSKMTALSGALGLRADVGTDVAVVEAGQLVALRSQLQTLTGGKTGQEILGVVSGWKGNADEVVALKQRFADSEQLALNAEFDGVIEGGVKELRIPPAERESLKALILGSTGGKVTKDSVTGLRAYVATRSPIPGAEATPQKKGGAHVMTEEHQTVARWTGQDPKEIEKLLLTQAGAPASVA